VTIDEIRTLYAFNRWATHRILEATGVLSPDDLARDLRTSYKSVRGTLVHTMWAEWIWLQRWLGSSPRLVFSEDQFPGVGAIESRWAEVERDRQDFIEPLTDEGLRRVVPYVNMQGRRREYPLVHMMQHVVNHSSYHRGQVVTLLRQLGRVPPATDFLDYFDEHDR
jgi:uncharacterized damage-inducible protein DinB